VRVSTTAAATSSPVRGAPLWSRFAGGALDWLLVSVGAWVGALLAPAAADALDLGDLGQIVFAAAVSGLGAAAYFTVLLRSGRTLGMRANGLRVVAQDGRPPTAARALARGIAAGASGAAWVLLVLLALSSPSENGAPTTEQIAAAIAWIVGGVALAGHLTQLVDRSRRCLQDRVFGLTVADERDVPVWRLQR
jgi:uncharacterized RDD family membrane protein YckC